MYMYMYVYLLPINSSISKQICNKFLKHLRSFQITLLLLMNSLFQQIC